MRRFLLLTPFALLFATTAASAAPADCSAHKWSVAREVALMAAPTGTVKAAPDAAWSGGTGSAFVFELAPLAEVSFALAPERAPKAATFAGVVRLPAMKQGPYLISLSDGAWIDVVQAGRLVPSDDHSGQAECAVHKSVRFTLSGEPVTIQISGATVAKVTLALTAAE